VEWTAERQRAIQALVRHRPQTGDGGVGEEVAVAAIEVALGRHALGQQDVVASSSTCQ